MTDSSDAEKRFCPTLWWGFFLSLKCCAHAHGELQVLYIGIDSLPLGGSETDVTKLTDMIFRWIGLFDVITQIEPGLYWKISRDIQIYKQLPVRAADGKMTSVGGV